jgi:hypothetical protein
MNRSRVGATWRRASANAGVRIEPQYTYVMPASMARSTAAAGTP